jgi:hypothetical protein
MGKKMGYLSVTNGFTNIFFGTNMPVVICIFIYDIERRERNGMLATTIENR